MKNSKFKNCKKGYSCGAGCISFSFVCHKEYPEGVSAPLNTVSKVIKSNISPPGDRPKEYATDLGSNPDFDFDKAKVKDKLGEGAFGEVYTTDGPPPGVIKEGYIGRYEAQVLDITGKEGLSPKLIAASMLKGEGDPIYQEPGTEYGRMAMEKVSGQEMATFKYKGIDEDADEALIEQRTKAVYDARIKLHKLGISHNDMHNYNVFIDEGGNAKFIDMGLADPRPHTALIEAIGRDIKFRDQRTPFFRNERMEAKLQGNKAKIQKEMVKDGLSPEVFEVIINGRNLNVNPDRELKKLAELGFDVNKPENKKLIMKYIDIAYDGVE